MTDLLANVFGTVVSQITSRAGFRLERAELQRPVGAVVAFRAPESDLTVVNVLAAHRPAGEPQPVVLQAGGRHVTVTTEGEVGQKVRQVLDDARA